MLSLTLMANALLLPTSRSPAAVQPLTRRGAMQAAGAAAAFSFARGAKAEDEAFSRMGGLLEPFIDTQKGYKLYVPAGWNKFDADPGVYDIKYQDIIESETTVQVSSSPVQTATSVTALGELQEVGEKFAKSRSAKLVDAKQTTVDGSLVYTLERACASKIEECHVFLPMRAHTLLTPRTYLSRPRPLPRAVEGEQYHELLALCINKGKLFRVSTVTSNKKWSKRAWPRDISNATPYMSEHVRPPSDGSHCSLRVANWCCAGKELYRNVVASFVPKGY